jgi:hypothetical protein
MRTLRSRNIGGSRVILVAVALVLVVTGRALAALAPGSNSTAVALANPGLDQIGDTGMPIGWSVVGSLPAGATVRAEKGGRSGTGSVLLAASSPASLTLLSEPVELAVGHVYRLSCYVRTEGALSDVTARYPTAVAATTTMASFPFTNHASAVGGSREWTKVETLFVATARRDRVRLHLGLNGSAVGKAWFDDVALEEIADIDEYIPLSTVRWAGQAYRYDDRGWIFVHIEGEPYERGYQYGYLLADEIVAYMSKLANLENAKEPVAGWNALRLLADATLLRGFDPEYLEEMRGIAEGANRGGARYEGRPLDLTDTVTINSAIDLGQLRGGLRVTPSSQSGRSFLAAEEELNLADRTHKCSSFSATGPATADGRVVFGQMFMWNGYSGVHFNVICDVVPSRGQRLVYQTFPGGIHSGTDFYMNKAGIIIGETTVQQTPYDPTGTPQSNRIRKAAQYATSIDEVVTILRTRNNGMYTNDWTLADLKRNESAVYLLGTHKERLWRSTDAPAPFGTPGFLWANNNNRDLDVRREYAVQNEDAPYDLAFAAWNRDIAFWQYYQRFGGKIDVINAVNLMASSPINRPHACDGKVTNAEMASELVFMVHFGKTTQREKFPSKENRRMPDLPGATPHMTLGYSMPSPIFITAALQKARARSSAPVGGKKAAGADTTAVAASYDLEARKLWRGSIVPASNADNWLTSGSAAYWQLLQRLPTASDRRPAQLRNQLAELNARLGYLLSREPDVAPAKVTRRYDGYAHYQLPRIKGTFALHQLRLLLGNEVFLKAMDELHTSYRERAVTTAQAIEVITRVSGRDVGPFIRQWLERTGVPRLTPSALVVNAGDQWQVALEVNQQGAPYHLLTTVEIEAGGTRLVKPVEIKGERTELKFSVADKPVRLLFNPGFDVPVEHERFYIWANYSDDFPAATIVYGTARQVEANHTLALRFQTTLADAFAEILPPVVKDGEIDDATLAGHDLIVLGQWQDNALIARLAPTLGLELGNNWFRWQGTTYASPDDGLYLAAPNPWNPKHAVFMFVANSALELHQMTKSYPMGLPSWALFRGDNVKEQGYHPVARFDLSL